MSAWGWAAFSITVVSAAAVVMAAQPFAQAIWGRPKITFAFTRRFNSNFRELRCFVFNEPIDRGLLRLLRVRREAANGIMSGFDIQRKDGEFVAALRVPTERFYQAEKTWATLPAFTHPAQIVLVRMSSADGQVRLGDWTTEETPRGLQPGEYDVEVWVHTEGKRYSDKNDFLVMADGPYVDWITDKSKHRFLGG